MRTCSARREHKHLPHALALITSAAHAQQMSIQALEAQVVEQARRGKLIGASLEARVLLWLPDEGLREGITALNAADNGVDPLRYLFITSQVPACSTQTVICTSSAQELRLGACCM